MHTNRLHLQNREASQSEGIARSRHGDPTRFSRANRAFVAGIAQMVRSQSQRTKSAEQHFPLITPGPRPHLMKSRSPIAYPTFEVVIFEAIAGIAESWFGLGGFFRS